MTDFQQFKKEFNPIENLLAYDRKGKPHKNYIQYGFDIVGPDLAFVKWIRKEFPMKIWTMVFNGADNEILPGYHPDMKPVAYTITQKEWTKEYFLYRMKDYYNWK